MEICEVKNLSKTYSSFSLSNISFQLNSGRIKGFVGRNGAGKTTTIKSMLGLVHPDFGEVYYFGLPFFENERTIKQNIGYSTGIINYYSKKKIKKIVEVTKTFYENWDDNSYNEYKDLFSINENKMPCELSDGMKVKFNLLIALSHRAKILILDEPTSGLDPFSRDELIFIFEELKKRGVCILFSTHIISDIEKCADDIMYIRNGHIIADCSKETFKQKFCENESFEECILRMERDVKID